jgi:hypothetical protein
LVRSPSGSDSSSSASTLVDRDRFPRERGLLHLQPRRLADPQIGGHDHAGFEQHDVAGDDLGSRHRNDRPIAEHRRHRSRHRLQRLHGALGTVLLDAADDGVQDDDRDDRHGVVRVADHPRDDGGGEQHQDHEVGELADEDAERRSPAAFG